MTTSATSKPAETYDVLTMGRVGVDLYPQQPGVSLAQVTSFGKHLGGSPTNVAVAAARYGHRAAVITRTGADPFGEFIHEALRAYQVDDRFVTSVPRLPTPVTFCEILPPYDFPLYFYRYPKAPDMEISTAELDFSAIKMARIFWATVTGLSEEPSGTATLGALAARDGLHSTVLDLDYRPTFWSSMGAARQRTLEALPFVTVAVGNLDECEMAVGTRDPEAAADALLDLGLRLAIVKMGPEGVLARTADTSVRVPPVAIEVLNGLGAGDAFGGALCHGLLRGWGLEHTLRFANAAGAIVASRLGCSDAMPHEAEVTALLGENTHA